MSTEIDQCKRCKLDMITCNCEPMTTQDRMDAITPYQQDDFITCQTEFDYSYCVNIWLILKKGQEPDKVNLINPLIEYSMDLEFPHSNGYAIAVYGKYGEPVPIDDLLDGALEIIKHYKVK